MGLTPNTLFLQIGNGLMIMKKIIGLAVLALTVSACDDSDSSSSAASPSPTPTPTATPGASPSPSPDPSASPSPTPTPTPVDYGRKGKCLELVNEARATTQSTADLGCPSCGVTNEAGVLDMDPDNFAVMSTDLSLLGAGGMSAVSLTVNLAEVLDPNVEPTEINEDNVETVIGLAPAQPGFTVSFPTPALAGLAIAPTLTVETLNNGESVEFADYPFGFSSALALGSILNGLVLDEINDAQVYLPVEATEPYDQIRITLNAELASLLLSVNLHNACVAGESGDIDGDF